MLGRSSEKWTKDLGEMQTERSMPPDERLPVKAGAELNQQKEKPFSI